MKKLSLNRETIRKLDEARLGIIQGGGKGDGGYGDPTGDCSNPLVVNPGNGGCVPGIPDD